MINMNNRRRFIGRILGLGVLGIAFGYLYSRGLSPVAAVLVLICCRGLFRFLYAVVSFILTAALIIAILGFIIY